MIQRPQSILLAAITLALSLMLVFPLWEKKSADGSEVATLTAFTLTHTQGTSESSSPAYWIAALALLGGGISAYGIFLYSDRKKQMLLGALNSVVIAGTSISVLLKARDGSALFEPNQPGVQLWPFYLPILCLLFNMIANRLIRRDDNLVKSMDRIR